MKRKVFISTLVLFFFVSTTGLPVTMHLCAMDNSEMETCEMHSHPMQCEGARHSDFSKVKVEKKDCCETEYKYEAINDQFLQINSPKVFLTQNIFAVINFDLSLNDNSIVNTTKYITDSSPPALISNQIYLNNSILII